VYNDTQHGGSVSFNAEHGTECANIKEQRGCFFALARMQGIGNWSESRLWCVGAMSLALFRYGAVMELPAVIRDKKRNPEERPNRLLLLAAGWKIDITPRALQMKHSSHSSCNEKCPFLLSNCRRRRRHPLAIAPPPPRCCNPLVTKGKVLPLLIRLECVIFVHRWGEELPLPLQGFLHAWKTWFHLVFKSLIAAFCAEWRQKCPS